MEVLDNKTGLNPDFIENLLDFREENSVLSAKRVMDGMPGGFFVYRADDSEEILYVNEALIRMFGCGTLEEFRELTGNSFRGIVHPDDLEEVEQSIREQIADNQYDLDYVEYRIIRKDGQIRWIDDYGHFIRSEASGDIFYVFAGDATDKRMRQDAARNALILEKSENEQHLQNQINDYIQQLEHTNQKLLQRLEMIEGLSIDYDTIFYANLDQGTYLPYRVSHRVSQQIQPGCETFDFEQFVLNYTYTWVFPSDRQMLINATNPEYIKEKLEQENVFFVNYRVTGDASARYLQMRVVNVGKPGHVSQVMMGYRSIDAEIRREMEQNSLLEDALNHAKSAILAKDAFLANMSHDLRTPMNAILGFTALAKKHINAPAKLTDYLDKIQNSASQLLRLTNDVLEFSRIDAGNIQIQELPYSLLDILAELEASVMPAVSAKNLSFSLDTSGIKHHQVLCDREKLYHIIRHLTGNAIQYTNPGGCVSVTAKEQFHPANDYRIYQFIVEDTGIGISKDFLEHIFEPFERQKNTTLSGVHGTGLGLTIAKNVSEILGGTIQAESTPGKGSRFIFSLGIRLDDSVNSAGTGEGRPSEPDRAVPKILIVDDNELNMEIAVELMEDAGFLTDTAKNGLEAFEKVKAAPPEEYSLVLMDIQMPVMDGHEATRAIRALPDPAVSRIPIVALSANSFEEDIRRSMECGMNAHLPKPIDISRLLELIETLLKKP